MANKKNNIKWRTILGLLLIYIAMWFNWQWVWGILFLLWVIPDLISGTTYFLEPITKTENPLLYWIIMVSWILMCIYAVLPLLIPELNYY